MKLALKSLIGVVLLSASLSEGSPHTLKACGMDVGSALGKGFVRGVMGIGVDCVLWGCLPVVAAIGVLTGPAEELDFDCAGAIVEGRLPSSGGSWMAIDGDFDSARRAEKVMLRHCKERGLRACRIVLRFRHAAAVYAPVGRHGRPHGDLAPHVAQAGDLPTAKALAKARCETAYERRCILLLSHENAG